VYSLLISLAPDGLVLVHACDFQEIVGGTSATTSLSERMATCTRVEAGTRLALTSTDPTASRSALRSSETSPAGYQTALLLMTSDSSSAAGSHWSANQSINSELILHPF